MNVSDFDYDLPAERIAQEPSERRDGSRLMVVGPTPAEFRHERFPDLRRHLRPGDLLVLNDTRVLPARLLGSKATGGRVELLLLESCGGGRWICLLRASRNPRPGDVLRFPGGLRGVVGDRRNDTWAIRLEHPSTDPWEVIEQVGVMPLPPYIRRDPGDPRSAMDRERYQTVYSAHPGAVAAPTAGLHFTPDLLEALERDGVRTTRITLHVGPGTFLPVRAERVEDHAMHSEVFTVGGPAGAAIAETRAAGGRVVAVGTTVVRTLEGNAREDGTVAPGSGECDLFIYPGYRFKAVDAILTNFHLPRSTLLMLVSAFAGRERILEAYRVAVEREYRFYSYGDAMLLLKTP